ncbi:MAG: SET domain-containing protein-lysine N-methyltransferase [Myxococcales bacterium]|nr:SET domain-containing protein-lysine N-methyltransferase [Myxococcales bacterium]
MLRQEPAIVGYSGWLTSKACVGRVDKLGHRAVFAAASIAQGELVAAWGGQVVDGLTLQEAGDDARRLALQIEEDLYIVSVTEGPSDWINHCCDPNTGLSGQLVLVALRAIEPGEEICFDYAMTDGSRYDEFDCQCGADNCRGRVSGDDWRDHALWARYDGYFAPYLARRIARLKELEALEAQRAWRGDRARDALHSPPAGE